MRIVFRVARIERSVMMGDFWVLGLFSLERESMGLLYRIRAVAVSPVP